MSQRIMPRKVTNSFYYVRDSVKPMQCVDFRAESKETKVSSKPPMPCDIEKFLNDFKKNLKID